MILFPAFEPKLKIFSNKVSPFAECNSFFTIFLKAHKGQIISEGLFGVLEFSLETNDQIHCSNKNEFEDTKNRFEII